MILAKGSQLTAVVVQPITALIERYRVCWLSVICNMGHRHFYLLSYVTVMAVINRGARVAVSTTFCLAAALPIDILEYFSYPATLYNNNSLKLTHKQTSAMSLTHFCRSHECRRWLGALQVVLEWSAAARKCIVPSVTFLSQESSRNATVTRTCATLTNSWTGASDNRLALYCACSSSSSSSRFIENCNL